MSYIILLTVLLSPLYVWRFTFLGIPLNFLLVWSFITITLFSLYIVKKQQLKQFFYYSFAWTKQNFFICCFFTFAFISLPYPNFDLKKVGQFTVVFLQPIFIFYFSKYFFYKNPEKKKVFIDGLYLTLALFGALAAIQYFTLLTLPEIWQGNSVEPKRAISFFGHPNFYALWGAPLLAFLIPDLRSKVEDYKKQYLWIAGWFTGGFGLFLSLSRAGWISLAVAGTVYLVFAANKKIRQLAGVIFIIIIMIFAAIPNLRYRVVLPFYGEKSAISRLSLWNTGVKAIKKSPLLGLGLTGFSKNWKNLNTDPNLDTHNFPHNIFLNFWIETGLFGLISFLGISFLVILKGLKNRQDLIGLGGALFIVTLLTQGLLDNPYFKNDLALVFWITLSLFF